jgi:hypothetical protein
MRIVPLDGEGKCFGWTLSASFLEIGLFLYKTMNRALKLVHTLSNLSFLPITVWQLLANGRNFVGVETFAAFRRELYCKALIAVG